MSYYNYEYQNDITGDLKPENSHLEWELATGNIIFVLSTDNTKVYHLNTTTNVLTQLDVDPSDTSADNKSRDHDIQAAWFDKTNKIIYFGDCDQPGDNFDVWKLDYTSSELTPTVTEIGTSSTYVTGTVKLHDIIKHDSDIYAFSSYENPASTYNSDLFLVTSAPFSIDKAFSNVIYKKTTYFFVNGDELNVAVFSGFDQYDIETLDAANDDPIGICFDGTYFYVTDNQKSNFTVGKVFKYDSSFTLQTSYTLDSNNLAPRGIEWDGTYFYVIDASATEKVFIYDSSFTYDSDIVLDFDGDSQNPLDITWDGVYFYVVVQGEVVYKYNTSFVFQVKYSIGIGSYDTIGITYKAPFYYVGALNKSTAVISFNVYDSTFTLIRSYTEPTSSTLPFGLTYDGWYFYGASNTQDNIFVYFEGTDLIIYDIVADTLDLYEITPNNIISDNDNLKGLAYNAGILYYTLEKLLDEKNYLQIFVISTLINTEQGEFNVSLMLNRNTDLTNETPFNLEKAFEVIDAGDAGRKIYQLSKNRAALNYISFLGNIRTDGNIVGITDTYLFYERSDTTIELWKFVDRISEMVLFPDAQHPIFFEGGLPEAEIDLSDTLAKYLDRGVFIQIIGSYASQNLTEGFYFESGGFNNEVIGTQGTAIDFIDSATLYNGQAEIIESWQNHKNILRLLDDVTPTEDPTYTYNITAATSGTREFYIGTNDVTELWLFGFYDTSATDYIIKLRITSTNLYYLDSSDVWQTIQAVANNTLYHIKIVWRANNTFDIYINSTIQVNNQACNNNQSSGVDKFIVTAEGDSEDYFYLDAWGNPAKSNYYEGQSLRKYDTNQVILEGMILELNLRSVPFRSLTLRSRAHYELLQTKPHITDYTNYTGKKTGPLISQLLSDFCEYVIAGVLSDGARTWTCPDDFSANGDKDILTIINELSEAEAGFVARLTPTGEVDFDDATKETGIYIHSLSTYKNVDVYPVSDIVNYVRVWGAINPATGEKYGPGLAEDLESQRLHGKNKWEKTYAGVSNEDALDDIAENKLSLIAAAPLIVEIEISKEFPIFGQPGELVFIGPNVEITNSDQSIPTGYYIIINSRVDPKNRMIDYKLSDGIYRENHPADEDMTQQNSQLILQNAAEIANRPIITEDSGVPSITPSSVGDIYINTDNLAVYMAAATSGAYSFAYLGKAQASAFTKDSVANLIAWYDAAEGITKDGADLVAQWNDQSDGNNNLVQAVGANKPLWVDAQFGAFPVVRFDGITEYMQVAFTLIQPTTVFIVLKVLSNTGEDYWFDGATGSTIMMERLAGGIASMYAGTYLDNGAFNDNTVYLFTSKFNGVSSSIRQNDDTENTGNTGAGSPGGITLGSGRTPSSYSNVEIAEVLVYSAALSDANQQIVRNYLNNKYAIY